jgi:hypothetical protein
MSSSLRKTRKRARLPSCSEPLFSASQNGPGALTPWIEAQGSTMSWRGRSRWSAYSAPKKVVPALVASSVKRSQISERCFGARRLSATLASELAELVDLEQRRRLPGQRGDETRARGDALAAEMIRQPRLEQDLLDRLSRVVLAAAALGDAEHVEVRAQVARVRTLRPISVPSAASAAPTASQGCGRIAVARMCRTMSPSAPSSRSSAGRRRQRNRWGGAARTTAGQPAPSPAARPPDARHRGACAVEHQRRIGLPAALHGEVVDRAGADALGLEPAQVFAVKAASSLPDCADQAAKRSPPAVAQRPLQREPDAHPAVVVEIGVATRFTDTKSYFVSESSVSAMRMRSPMRRSA